ncbi:MAG: FAD-dependent oxidoreductase [Gammaproteobacteria bacterium]|nr:FAD-dependent oxidoreductase [Gammaproteobacteria bacterium]
MKTIVIVGGGFAGVWAALAAARQIDEHAASIAVLLISSDRFLTIRPRLYEANPRSLREPLHATLDPVGVAIMESVVEKVDPERRIVTLRNSAGRREERRYDRLILTAGSRQKPLPVAGAVQYTWNIDTCAAAAALDDHLLDVVRHPESAGHDTIAIIGGGFAGIELATELRSRLAGHGGPDVAAATRIVIVEQAEVIGPELGPGPRPDIERALQSQRIEVLVGTRVDEFEERGVVLSDGRRIDTATAIVTAGLEANPLTAHFDVELDAMGRLPVDDTLRVVGVPGVFAAGDVARAYVDDAHLAMMSCQHAMPMGRYAGHNAVRDILGLTAGRYRQADYVTCLDLGTSGAVFTTGWERVVKLRGPAAKEKKRTINTRWIYPPTGDKHSILETADIARRSPR